MISSDVAILMQLMLGADVEETIKIYIPQVTWGRWTSHLLTEVVAFRGKREIFVAERGKCMRSFAKRVNREHREILIFVVAKRRRN